MSERVCGHSDPRSCDLVCRIEELEARAAHPSPALTREALLDAANEVAEASGELIHWDVDQQWWELPKGPVPYLDAILAALGTPPPEPTSTREETL